MAGTARFDSFTAAYIHAALCTTNDESRQDGGDPLVNNYDAEDFEPDSLAAMVEDCRRFQDDHRVLLEDHANCLAGGDPWARAGTDFWLTRCGHGAGFWDGDWAEPAAGILSEAAEGYGSQDLILTGEDRIFAYPARAAAPPSVTPPAAEISFAPGI